jgi:hypothetical protein
MTVDDLKQQVETTLGTTEKSFSLGELRILCVLFLLLLAPTGARPASVLKLHYRDIRVVLARDPEGGPHKVLISSRWSSPTLISVPKMRMCLGLAEVYRCDWRFAGLCVLTPC